MVANPLASVKIIEEAEMAHYEILILVVGIISILMGLLIIMKPKILPYLVGSYFVVVGILWIVRAVL